MGLFGSLIQYQGQKETNLMNRQIAKDAQIYDQKMWNLQNEYNSPAAQMQRFQDAGLNPNLMYGQGSSGNATNAPQGRTPQMDNPAKGLDIPSLLGIMNQIAQNNKIMSEAEMAKYSAQVTSHLDPFKEAANRMSRDDNEAYKLASLAEKANWDNKIIRDTFKSIVLGTKAESTIKQNNAKISSHLAQFNMGMNDGVYLRLGALLLNKLGINVDTILNKFK